MENRLKGPKEIAPSSRVVRVYPLRGFIWHRVLGSVFTRNNPKFEIGVSSVIIGFIFGAFSAAGLADGVKLGGMSWSFPLLLALLACSAIFIFIGYLHLRKFGPSITFFALLVGGGLPLLANGMGLFLLFNR